MVCIYIALDQSIVLEPSSGSMLGGTLIQIIGNNISFDEELTYTCLFDETEEAEGVYFMQSGVEQILCVSPLLRRIGRINFTLSYSNPQDGTQKAILATDTFISCKCIVVFMYHTVYNVHS